MTKSIVSTVLFFLFLVSSSAWAGSENYKSGYVCELTGLSAYSWLPEVSKYVLTVRDEGRYVTLKTLPDTNQKALNAVDGIVNWQNFVPAGEMNLMTVHLNNNLLTGYIQAPLKFSVWIFSQGHSPFEHVFTCSIN